MSYCSKLSILLIILNFSVFAEISSVERTAGCTDRCNKLCTEYSKDSYGNIVSVRIPSEFQDPQEIYPGVQPRCIPCDCGDGVISDGESCDDGNNKSLDGCSADCQREYCGDGIKSEEEECDEGVSNSNQADKCRVNCELPACGDGIKDLGEACDLGSGNQNGLIGCDTKCQVVSCGDGKVTGAELCDDGNSNNNDSCTNSCMPAKCGDGYLNIGVEKCDGSLFCTSVVKLDSMTDEIFNSKKCDSECEVFFPLSCGDGVKNGTEQCDGSDFGALTKPADISQAIFDAKKCSASCKVEYPAYCGDKVRNGSDECDGTDFTNAIKPAGMSDEEFATKKCSSTCKITYGAYCGDGIKNNSEKCDGTDFKGLVKPSGMPTAIFNSKSCNPVTCEPIYDPYCGDGVKNGNDQCDKKDFTNVIQSANMSNDIFNAKTCNTKCEVVYKPFCGDGIKNLKEVCDGTDFKGLKKPVKMPGEVFAAKACDPVKCVPVYEPYCGDKILQEDRFEQCDDGDTNNIDDCNNSCQLNNKCIYVAAWNNDSLIKLGLLQSYRKYEYASTGQDVPGCFSKMASLSKCEKNYDKENFTVYGWCKGSSSIEQENGKVRTLYDLAAFLGVPNKNDYKETEKYKIEVGSEISYQAEFLMDNNCNYIPKNKIPEGSKLCGFAGISWSPISLILDETKSLEEDMRVVEFSLDINNPESFSLWKASEHAPLLVYDPAKTGEINSATQLFGNWTFGGKPSLATISTNSKANNTPWDNGYEALATLDKDHNGKVDGEELNVLSLWFDKNRDAKVDDGEIQSLSSQNISALFYNAKSVLGSKDFKADVGFERTVDGRVLTGSSVDWFAESFSSKKEAADALGVIIKSDSEDKKTLASNNWKENSLDFTPHMVENNKEDVSGYWRWTINDKKGENHPGFLVLEQNTDGSLFGFTVVETQLAKNKTGLRSGIKIIPLEGNVTKTEGGNLKVNFIVESEEFGGKATNTVVVNPDGMILTGNTMQEFIGNERRAKSAKINYEWKAERVLTELN